MKMKYRILLGALLLVSTAKADPIPMHHHVLYFKNGGKLEYDTPLSDEDDRIIALGAAKNGYRPMNDAAAPIQDEVPLDTDYSAILSHEENISDVIAKSDNYERDIEDAYQKGLDDGDAVPTANNGIVPLYPVTYSR